MDASVVQKIAGLVQDLPALPTVAQQALALLSDPATEPEELQAVLARDQALSLKVLQRANSAYYRRSREVTTLTGAVLMLGFKTIQSLLLSSALHRVLTSGGAPQQLWEHSFAAAVGCREACRTRGLDLNQREEAFLGGLFHDVAKGVIAGKFPGVYDEVRGVAGEVEALGFHHGHLGQVLLTKWEIPELLVRAVGSHHADEPEGLGALVAVGDFLAWGVAPGVGADPPDLPEGSLAGVGLDSAQLEQIQGEIEGHLAEERSSHDGA